MAQDFNSGIIKEFRANAGKVGGPFAGAPMVLLTTKGARSGEERTTPLVSMIDGDQTYIFASMGGAPKHPAWYHNLVAHPDVIVEQGTETFKARAVVMKDGERDALFARQAARIPAFAEYQRKTTRRIPVIRLDRAKTRSSDNGSEHR